MFRSQDKPSYGPGIYTCIIACGLVVILTLLMNLKSLSVHGWSNGHALDSEEAIRFSVDHGVKCWVERYPLAEAAKAMETCAANKARFRNVLIP